MIYNTYWGIETRSGIWADNRIYIFIIPIEELKLKLYLVWTQSSLEFIIPIEELKPSVEQAQLHATEIYNTYWGIETYNCSWACKDIFHIYNTYWGIETCKVTAMRLCLISIYNTYWGIETLM